MLIKGGPEVLLQVDISRSKLGLYWLWFVFSVYFRVCLLCINSWTIQRYVSISPDLSSLDFCEVIPKVQWQWCYRLLATRFTAYPGCRWAHLTKRSVFMWIKILCIEYIFWGIPTIESKFVVANMVETATVKDVPINNDALLNIQAC